jgi:hypothetical protein
LERVFLQPVFFQPRENWSRRGISVQTPDAGLGTVNHASEFGAGFPRAVFKQALLRFFNGKPGGISIRFLRRFEPGHFAKVGSNGSVRFAMEVTGEGDFFDPAMDPSFFIGLKGSRLSVREARLSPAFGENPTSTASLDQQELDAAFTDPVTNGGDLLPCFRKPRRLQALCGQTTQTNSHGT